MDLLGELEKAYEFFKTHPWVQEASEQMLPDGKMGYCTVGVCAYYDNNITEDCGIPYFHPTGPHRHDSPHYYKLTGALSETLLEMAGGYVNLIDWNDAEGRTVEEVNELWVNTINRLKKEQEEYVPVSA